MRRISLDHKTQLGFKTIQCFYKGIRPTLGSGWNDMMLRYNVKKCGYGTDYYEVLNTLSLS